MSKCRVRRYLAIDLRMPSVQEESAPRLTGAHASIDRCSCFDQLHVQTPSKGVHFHSERQDTSAQDWLHIWLSSMRPQLMAGKSSCR